MVALLAVLNLTACTRGESRPRLVRLQGAGASFPAPLYGRWFKTYNAAHPDVQIDYQSVGSGSGVKSVIDGMVDFGASDAAMTADEIKRVHAGIQLLPMTAGSIVLTYNLSGVRDLKLSRAAYTGIFLGRIKSWNAPEIAASNPGKSLPNLPIRLVVRADSSGTTYVFTKHLSAISPEFAESPGVNKMPSWPTGTRSKGNEGVASSVKTTPGALGYLEYGFAETQHMAMAALENKAGKFVAPNNTSGQVALSEAELPEDMVAWIPDPRSAEAYPIVTYTWLIVYRRYEDPQKLAALKDFVRYGAAEGQELALSLGYIPLPESVRKKITSAVDNVQLAANNGPTLHTRR